MTNEKQPQFTPGPWRAQYTAITAKGAVDTCFGTVWGPIAYIEPLLVHDTEGREWSTSGTPKANAHLIAAAPCLYEALQYARRFLNADDHDTDYVDAILAKARNQTKEPADG